MVRHSLNKRKLRLKSWQSPNFEKRLATFNQGVTKWIDIRDEGKREESKKLTLLHSSMLWGGTTGVLRLSPPKLEIPNGTTITQKCQDLGLAGASYNFNFKLWLD